MNDNSPVRITLLLTREEWCEVVNAISSKSIRVAQGDYGETLEEEGDDARWVETLDSAYKKITAALDDHEVTY